MTTALYQLYYCYF